VNLGSRFEELYPEFMTTGFVAEHCGVTNATVLRWIEKGRLPAFRLPDRHYRIHREDFVGFLTEYSIPVHRGASGNKRSGGHTQ